MIKCLDLFCGGGGAGMGYHLSGFDVTGVDIKPQKKYPFKFIQSDALKYLAEHGCEYDFIHASPPCQGYSHLTPSKNKDNHPRMIPALRDLLFISGKPYVIENVAGARSELREPIMLCGSMFGLRTRRHRYFETSHPIKAPCKCNHNEIPLLVTTASKASREKRIALGMKPKTVNNAIDAYGIDWMGFKELKETIPPIYTKYIAEQMMKVIVNSDLIKALNENERLKNLLFIARNNEAEYRMKYKTLSMVFEHWMPNKN